MHFIVCIDDRDGLSFCGRRLSKDRLLNEHMLRLTAGQKLWMSPYSGKMFSADQVLADENFLDKAQKGDYCFLETDFPDSLEQVESVTVYYWNRSYPSTERFPRQLLGAMRLVCTEEFAGSSHEKITMERYAL